MLVAEALAEGQPLVGVQGEGQHPRHQPLLGLGGMHGQGQRVGGVVVPIHVADLQFDFVDGGFERHGYGR